MSLFFTGITHDNVDKVWHVVEPMVGEALKREGGVYTAENMREGLLTSALQLWVTADEGVICACMITELRNHPGARIAHILVLGGENIEAWKESRSCWEQFELWANLMGCKYIEACTRPGVSKLTKDIGMVKYAEIIRKELSPITLQ